MTDIRQSPEWTVYLKSLGWNSYRTSSGINIEIRESFLGGLVKIQKPKPFENADLAEIEDICRLHKALFIKIEPYVGQDIELLKSAGYEISWFPMTPTATYFMHLDKPEEELWNNISHSGKYSIHRAEREGANVRIYQKPEMSLLKDFYQVLKYTGMVQKLYVPPIKQLITQVEAFGDRGFLLMVYDKDNNLCGAKWHVAYEDTVLYVSGGTSEIGRKDKSGYELVWKSILYFKSLGYKILDFEGKDDKRFPSFTKRWGGFSHFKEKFGGEAIEFPHPYVKYLSPIMQTMHKTMGFGV